jgi:hypothetical protein
LSYSLFKLKRPLEAFLQLLRQAKAFPNISAIPYFLGCYSWELGDYRGAGKWLGKFKTVSGGKEVKPGPFEHTELVALWEEITAASASPKTSRRRGPITLA